MICFTCDGNGYIITCCDDMCNGLGYCIHGDGEEPCPDCDGWGEVYEDEETEALQPGEDVL